MRLEYLPYNLRSRPAYLYRPQITDLKHRSFSKVERFADDTLAVRLIAQQYPASHATAVKSSTLVMPVRSALRNRALKKGAGSGSDGV